MITRENIIELSKNLKEPTWVLEKRLAIFDSLTDTETGNLDYSFDGVNVVCDGARVLNLANASKDKKLAQLLKKQMFVGHLDFNNKNFGLAAAAYTEAYCIILNDQSPAQLELLISQQPQNSFTYLFIVVEPGVRTTLLESIDVNVAHHLVIDLLVLEGASLNIVSSRNYETGKQLYISRRVDLSAHSEFELLNMNQGSNCLVENMTSNLSGEGAKSLIQMGFETSNQGVVDLRTINRHIALSTKSDIIIKGVAKDKAHVSCYGLIEIEESAKGSEGYQRSDILSISPQVKIISVPDLKIRNNEVHCSHGATTTHLNDESIFYLQSRGLTKEEAIDESVNAHLAPITNKLATYISKEYDI